MEISLRKAENGNKAFVMLFVITISSILLAIALGVANVTFKEVKFTTSAKDTNDAFLATDTGIEFALFRDKGSSFYAPAPGTWTETLTGLGASGTNCAKVTIVKDTSSPPNIGTSITAKGYSTGDGSCNATNPVRTERQLQVTYGSVIPVLDPSTVLLLHMDGSGTSFTDSSGHSHSVGAAGSSTQSTSQSKFGGSSANIAGTATSNSNYVNVVGNSDFDFSNTDLTIDFWAYLVSPSDTWHAAVSSGDFQGASSWAVHFSGTTMYLTADGGDRFSFQSSFTTGAWHHVAIVKSGTTVRLYLDGVQSTSSYTTTQSAAWLSTAVTNGIRIGASGSNSDNGDWNGYIDEFRILKGTAAWTSSFTPPSSPYSGGGGGSVPVVTISASPTSGTVNVVNPGLTWSATNSPTSCTASGDWSGAKAVSGSSVSQGVLTTVKTYTFTLTCSNGTGASSPASATVIVSAAALTFNPTSSGPNGTIQTYTVPTTGTYTIETWGAQGGSPSSYPSSPGGKGAYIKGDVSLNAGDVLNILVGQQGMIMTVDGSGGGGTFVVKQTGNVPLMIAGGGGGGSQNYAGVDASTSTSGTVGNTPGAAGGSGGSGGSANGWAGAGGGFSTNGAQGSNSWLADGGNSYLNGGAGGTGVFSGAYGGYGGGGGTHGGGWGGGGGGGYSGGAGPNVNLGGYGGGGGGGSYNSGTSQTNTASVQTGGGKVIITPVSGGGGSVPVVTISASPTSGTVNVVNPGLTWSATNSPTSCTASGDWSGAKAVSGSSVSQGVLTTVKTYTFTLTCSNGTGASSPASATVIVSAAGSTKITPTTGQIVTIPSGITTAKVKLFASGGNNGNQSGGTGAYVIGDFAVIAGDTLTFYKVGSGLGVSSNVSWKRGGVVQGYAVAGAGGSAGDDGDDGGDGWDGRFGGGGGNGGVTAGAAGSGNGPGGGASSGGVGSGGSYCNSGGSGSTWSPSTGSGGSGGGGGGGCGGGNASGGSGGSGGDGSGGGGGGGSGGGRDDYPDSADGGGGGGGGASQWSNLTGVTNGLNSSLSDTDRGTAGNAGASGKAVLIY